MSKIDLHMHSENSDDGDFSASVLADMAMDAGLLTFSIADHNNVNSIAAADDYCRDKDIEFIPAVELDCMFRGRVYHLLGYGIHYADKVYRDIWDDILGQEQHASRERVRLAREIGLEFLDEDIEALSKWGVIGGEMIGEAAMKYDADKKNPLLQPYYEGGARSDNPYVNFWWDFCSQGKPVYSEVEFMPFEQAVATIDSTGGVTVLAHPGNNVKEDMALLDAVMACGVKGVEAFSSYHNPEQNNIYKNYALEHGYLLTCGSDFHGKNKPAISMGSVDSQGMDDAMLDALHNAIKQMNP